MMIRDSGTTIEFWINSGNSTTFDNELPWAYIVNGTTSPWESFRYNAGAGWQRLGSWSVTTNQTVTFKLGDTGTSGFGGPTTFTHSVVRVTGPAKPAQPIFSKIGLDTITASWSAPSNGGSTITGYQIAYGTNGAGPTDNTIVNVTKSPYVMENLAMNTFYYAWVRAKNVVAWSPWSNPSGNKTLFGAYVNVNGVWKPAIPYVRSGGVWKQALPYILKGSSGGTPPVQG